MKAALFFFCTESQLTHSAALSFFNRNAEQLRDFIQQCLCIDPAERPSAAALLEHPFIRNAVDAGLIAPNDRPQPRLGCLSLSSPSGAETDDIIDHVIQW